MLKLYIYVLCSSGVLFLLFLLIVKICYFIIKHIKNLYLQKVVKFLICFLGSYLLCMLDLIISQYISEMI